MGQKVKKRPCKSDINKGKVKRDWGRGMACVGRSKHCTIVLKNHRGPIPGIEVGTCWWSRIQVKSNTFILIKNFYLN